MNRLFLVLTLSITLLEVSCDSAVKASLPTSTQPVCTSSLCRSGTEKKVSALFQKVADSCSCNGCSSRGKIYMDLYTFCYNYQNYDQATYAVISCMQNKLSDPCYTFNAGCLDGCFIQNNNQVYLASAPVAVQAAAPAMGAAKAA